MFFAERKTKGVRPRKAKEEKTGPRPRPFEIERRVGIASYRNMPQLYTFLHQSFFHRLFPNSLAWASTAKSPPSEKVGNSKAIRAFGPSYNCKIMGYLPIEILPL